jgi:hypothetical protein
VSSRLWLKFGQLLCRLRLRHRASLWGPAGGGGGEGGACGEMLGAMSRIAPPQPNKAMARIAPRLVPQPNGKQQNLAGPQLDSFGVHSRFEMARSSQAFYFCALAVPETRDRATTSQSVTTGFHNFTFSVGAIPLNHPYNAASFVLNSEPHTGGRPSVRLCRG